MEIDFNTLDWQFAEALCLIVLACIWVPLVKRAGFGRIIGYLAAGVTAGTLLTLSYEKHPEELLHFAEFGVVLFLFVIGLELRPDHLWEMRREIFGRGFLQVVVCASLILGPALLYGLEPKVAITVALGLALSSTALVMQGLYEKGQRGTPTGRSALSILLFEDMAIVP
ncbi:MAG: cation:proton antiporter, partial [Pseudomonadota bacterium]